MAKPEFEQFSLVMREFSQTDRGREALLVPVFFGTATHRQYEPEAQASGFSCFFEPLARASDLYFAFNRRCLAVADLSFQMRLGL